VLIKLQHIILLLLLKDDEHKFRKNSVMWYAQNITNYEDIKHKHHKVNIQAIFHYPTAAA